MPLHGFDLERRTRHWILELVRWPVRRPGFDNVDAISDCEVGLVVDDGALRGAHAPEGKPTL